MQLGTAQACTLCGAAEHVRLFAVDSHPVPDGRQWDLVQCAGCGLVFVVPMPGWEHLEGIYTRQTYYQQERKPRVPDPENPHVRFLQRFAATGRLLDVGCGPGHFLNDAKAAGWKVVGLDPNPFNATFAREAYGVEVHTGTLTEAPFRSGSFDVVCMMGVVEHLPDPVGGLKDLARLVRPGGGIFLLTQNIRSWLAWLMGRRFVFTIPPEHVHYFSSATVRRLLDVTGFALVSLRTRETITPEKAIRGLRKLLPGIDSRRDKDREFSRLALALAHLALIAAQPIRSALWCASLGADMWIYGRKR
jgi:SAM-dependent methyltransferase